MKKRNKVVSGILTAVFTVLSLAWVYPVFMVLMNSLRQERSITTDSAFQLPSSETFAGLENFKSAIDTQGFLSAFWYSLVITVTSVALILVFCSMCAWFITRVNSWVSKACYYLFVFSMVVPFQMLMFTLSSLADRLGFTSPYNICIIYLGFGAGLAVFMFAGFMKSIPIEIEEAAMIDGCGPIRTFFSVVFPILKPTMVSVGILETMWVWNDYLLPYLVLDLKRFKTIPIAVQYLRGGYGSVDMGAMMGMLVLAIAPILLFYFLCQRYIVSGIMAGAVKG